MSQNLTQIGNNFDEMYIRKLANESSGQHFDEVQVGKPSIWVPKPRPKVFELELSAQISKGKFWNLFLIENKAIKHYHLKLKKK